ncbi:uncharacterized protein PV07_11945 [Cladophialophora immunda]|uniref:Protein kinase domain-containing protein n=1 Tax=Cladophialophora immunda TaxID=569365 RepID=A0A0D2BXA6_9EURO|nr:uncharacterized protein PV07_11945 [Cladophialophora immunda]KIW23768.1 hypothetical protein PV07_11945 [Cladophialophora immunda]
MAPEQGSRLLDLFTDPEIQSFLKWKEANSRPGITFTDDSSYMTRKFLPNQAITKYFDCEQDSQHSKIKKLVAAATKYSTKPPQDVRALAKSYPKVFTILVIIGQSHHIDAFVGQRALQDDKLPYSPDKRDLFPKLAGGTTFFEEFSKIQWEFCVDPLSYSSGVIFENDRILPIASMKRVDTTKGSSASVHKITIHKEDDDLTGSSAPEEDSHEYVVKSYYPPDGAENYYSAEVEAFRSLNSLSEPIPNLIGFYGAFTQNQSRHIILQYANVGTLEDYWKRVTPPRLGEDIVALWENILKLSGALVQIHLNRSTDLAGRPRIFQGRHGDIKPSNVLVTGDIVSKPYGVQFMLADLGLSHFEVVVEGKERSTEESKGGSQAYSAPELNCSIRTPSDNMSKAEQSIDTWSLACVFSEFHAWTVGGKYGLEKYRQERMNDKEVGENMGACFHCKSGRLLRAVQSWHEYSKRICATEDSITPILWEKLLEHMFEHSPQVRLGAHQVLHRSQAVINEARNKSSSSTARGPPGPSPNEQNGPRPSTPPQLPREFYSQPAVHNYPEYPLTPPHDDRIELPHNKDSDHSPRLAQWVARGDTDNTSLKRQDNRDSNTSIYRYGRDSFPHGNGGDSTGTESHSKYHDTMKMRLHDRPGTEALTSRSADTIPKTSDFHSPIKHSLTTPSDSFSHRQQTPVSDMEHNSEFVERFAQMTMKGKEKAADKAHSHSRSHSSTHNRTPEKVLSVDDLNDWVQQTEAAAKRAIFHRPEITPLPHENELIGQLRSRDHIFILDDGESMTPYWNDVTKLYSNLISLIKRKKLDPNGSELRFIISDEGKENFHTTKLKNMVRRKTEKLNGESDFAHRLDEILQRTQKKLTKDLDMRPISLYVFTDGKWQPGIRQLDAVARSIQRLVNLLEEKGMKEQMVGIQFIRFGNDEEGMERLRWLDEELKGDYRLARDICDTTPADGNVWKMLLGSINGYWDADLESQDQP